MEGIDKNEDIIIIGCSYSKRMVILSKYAYLIWKTTPFLYALLYDCKEIIIGNKIIENKGNLYLMYCW